MHLKSLYLRNWRNYSEFAIDFDPKLNVIIGRNGLGKTNLIEAIYLLSTGRSFRTRKLQEAIKSGESFFFIEGLIDRDGIEERVAVSFDGHDKQVDVSGSRSKNLTALLGTLPGTLYAPADIALIDGAPAERRRFIDIHIAQSNPLYVYHLARYTRALKQRNTLLKTKNLDTIEIWEEELSRSGKEVMCMRADMVEELAQFAKKQLQELGVIEPLELTYAPSISIEQMQQYGNILQRHRDKDVILGQTQVGPHRDDFHLLLDGKIARSYASEGQKRSLLNALKLSEYHRLSQQVGTAALFAIDDFGMHLDPERTNQVKERLPLLGQTFLTSPVPCPIEGGRTISIESDIAQFV